MQGKSKSLIGRVVLPNSHSAAQSRIALQNSQRALICHRVPAQPGGGPGGGIAKKNLSKFPEVDIPQSRNSLKPKFPKVKSPPKKK